MDRSYGQGGPRQRDHPRTVPPYMGYPGGGRSYDDTYLRPQRGHKGNRRGPPQMDLPYRRPMDHGPVYNYPPYGYDQMGYPYEMQQPYHGGPPDRRSYPQGPQPGEGMRYNDQSQMSFRGRGGDRPHMRPGQGGERGGRPSGPPDQREMRGGEGRGEPRGDPREGRREYGGHQRDDEGRGPMRGSGGPGGPPMRGGRQGGPGGPPMRGDFSHRPYQQDPSGPGPAGIRGGRGMRGSRGSGRGGPDRAEPNGHHGGMEHGEPVVRRSEDRRGGRGRGDGGHGHGGPSDGPERRGGRGGDEAGRVSHQIVTRTRGSRGGKEGGPAPTYN